MTQSDMAEAMAEIRKVDPYFSKEAFVKECEFDIIPTVLEVCLHGCVGVGVVGCVGVATWVGERMSGWGCVGVVGCVGVATWVGERMSGRGCVGRWEDGWAWLCG